MCYTISKSSKLNSVSMFFTWLYSVSLFPTFPPQYLRLIQIYVWTTEMNIWLCKFCNVFRPSVHLSVVENHVVPYPMMPDPSLPPVLKTVTALQVVAVEAQVTMSILHYTSNSLEIGCIQKCSFCAQRLLAKSLACSLNWPQHSFWCSLHQKMLSGKRLKKQWSLYWVMDKSLHLRHC